MKTRYKGLDLAIDIATAKIGQEMTEKEELKQLIEKMLKIVEDMNRLVKDKDILLVAREEKKKDVFHT